MSVLVNRRRFLIAYGVLGAAALALIGGTTWFAVGRHARTASAPGCSAPIPGGESFQAAWRTTELFVADVILSREPGCGYDLATRHLRGRHSRAEWAEGGLPLKPFSTGYPPVPISTASRDPHAAQAVYMLSRRAGSLVVPGANGRPEIPMMVGIAAPTAGLGAYSIMLIVENGSWRVDSVQRVHLVHTGNGGS